MQEAITVSPGQCIRIKNTTEEFTNTATIAYAIPLLGHVAVWFEDAVSIFGNKIVQNAWNIPVSELLGITKVRHFTEVSCGRNQDTVQ